MNDSTDERPRLYWQPHTHDEWVKLTTGWPSAARAALTDLFGVQWALGALPDDPAQLCVLARATAAEWKIAWRRIKPLFPVIADGQRRNADLEKTWQKHYRIYLANQSRNAAMTKSRWKKRDAE